MCARVLSGPSRAEQPPTNLVPAAEQRSRLGAEEGAPGTEGEGEYLDARQRGLDDSAERRLAQIVRDYQDDINNYEILQKGTSTPAPTPADTLPCHALRL